jgi:putative ABC transport system permease protein
MTAIRLTPLDLALAASLLLVAALLSLAFRLRLERPLAVAGLRMCAQLLLVGLVLKFVFEQTSLAVTAAIAAVMIAVAGWEAAGRTGAPRIRLQMLGLGTATLMIVGLLASFFAVGALIGPDPWYAPRYLLPILGMVLGNALTAISLVFQTMAAEIRRDRAAIEARLALGHTRRAALDGALQAALRAGLTPILNAMAVTGVVTLPGMMSGQIIAGADPIEAAKYQVMIMFVLAGAAAVATVAAGLGSIAILTDSRHRLRVERLQAVTT